MRSAIDIASAVRSKEVAAADVVSHALAAIDDDDRELNALLEVFREPAIEQAAAIDTRIAAGERDRLPLAGVPAVLKDNIALSWGRTTAGSRMLREYRSPFNATAAQRLIEAGAIVIAKANLDEFAMGSSGENSAFGATRNPHASARVPGGSSSGSAAIVGAGLAPLALGSDTGGSIRQPAAFCGCVGLKPTYGRVSRYGLIAFASSLDQIGPLAPDVRTAAACLDVISGADPRDMTSSDRPAPATLDGLDDPLRDLVIGVPRQCVSNGNHAAVNAAVDSASRALEDAGIRVSPVDLPRIDHAIAAYYVLAPAEASSNLARYDGVRYGFRADLPSGATLEEMYVETRTAGFGPEVKRRIMLGAHVLSSGYHDAYYTSALKARRLIKADYDACFDPAGAGCAALLMPATPGPAFRIGEKTGDAMAMYLEDVYTVGVNLAGLPAITLPAAWAEVDGDRLPIGVQLVGAAWEEGLLLRIARALAKAMAFHPSG